MTRTGLVARLFSHSPEPEILLHEDSGFADGSLVRVSSRRGTLVLKARIGDDMRPGDAFLAMHWGSRFAGGDGTNALTVPAFDPYSKQPELKHAAVRIEAFAANWRGTFTAPATPDRQRAATAFISRFDYAALSLAEGPEILLRLDLANARDPEPKVLAALEDLFGGPAEALVCASDRAICACFKVPESRVRSAVAAGASLAKLQKELKCGTNCGSCVPELQRLMLAPGSARRE
jgi:assimilatory nitrate reductase catalytic subunit